MGEIVRLNQLPEGSGNLTSDDIFVFMDDPSGSGVTKKISLSQISDAIGGGGGGSSDPKVIYYSGVFPSTIHNLDHQDADMIVFDLKDNTNIPSDSGYLSLTGMKAGKDGQKITLMNITDHFVENSNNPTYKRVYIFNDILGSGSLPENRFAGPNLAGSNRLSYYNFKAYVLPAGFAQTNPLEFRYISKLQKWYNVTTTNTAHVLGSNSPGSVGGGGV